MPTPAIAGGASGGRTFRRALVCICLILAGVAPGGTGGNGASFRQDLRETNALFEDGRYLEAAERSRSLLEKAEQSFGLDSIQAAEVLDLLARSRLYGEGSQADSIEALGRRALRIKQAALLAHDPRIAESLVILGDILRFRGGSAESKSAYELALEIREEAFGQESLEVAEVLTRLGSLLFLLSDMESSGIILQKALQIQQKSGGPDCPEAARTLVFLASLARANGDYSLMKDYALESLRIREGAMRPDHPEIATSLATLSLALQNLGEFSGALAAGEKALRIRKKSLPPGHFQVGTSLGNLALLQIDLGDYARALSLMREASGPPSPGSAQNPPSGRGHTNMGEALLMLGNYPEAEEHLVEGLRLKEASHGTDDPELISTLMILAQLRQETGQLDVAKSLLERAQRIAVTSLGADHPRVARILESQARILRLLGQPTSARQLLERALEMRNRRLGPEHPEKGQTLLEMARVTAAKGDKEEALRSALEAESILREHLERTARGLAEREALRYEAVRSTGLDLALGMLRDPGALRDYSGSVRNVWTAVIRSRALILDEMASRHQTVLQAEDPISVTLMKDLEKSRRKLANVVRRGSGDQLPDRYLEEVGRARSDEERLERELAARSEVFRKERALERLGLDEVMAAAPAGAALVAYVQIDRGEVETNGRGRQTVVTTRPRRLYTAFTAGYDKVPSFVPLGDAESIDAAVHRWRELAGAAPASTQAETDYRAAAEVLRKRIWDPLRPSLHDASMVIVVPDGALHLVNLGSLPSGKDRYLIETSPPIHYVSAERDLPAAAQSGKRGSGILALGGPDFDAAGPEGGEVTFVSSLLRGTRAACRDFATLRFENVPNAKAEVEEVERLWKSSGRGDDARVLTGPGATESAIRELVPGKRVLHLATHGFFLEDRCDTPLARAAGGTREGNFAREEPLKGENPLLLSGLALSGANHRDEPADSGWKDDGILTAAEAASLDLRGVDWAVLSACETGIGPIQIGEGVLGLRRAFQVAGARTVIMSLWSVSDLASREWIRQLYKARLSGQSTIQSVRSASITILEARRKAGITTHPFYWGAFVAAGDWR